MALFVVILQDAESEVGPRLERAYPEPNHLKLRPDTYLLSGDLLIEDISEALGLNDQAGGAGVVFRLNGTYTGRTYRETWDWLARSQATIA